MTRFSAETLDLSRLPQFSLVSADSETIIAERMASLKVRFDALGVDYDVETLLTDPAGVLQREDAFRELLERQAINDAGRSLFLAYAKGAILDHIAATLFPTVGPRRLAGETDERFALRIALAPEAESAGTLGGYEYQAYSASILVKDALCLNHASGLMPPGDVRVVLVCQAGLDNGAEAEVLAAVKALVLNRGVKLATDTVSVALATKVYYDVEAVADVAAGPDPDLVKAQIQARLAAYAEDRRRAGKVVAMSALDGALNPSSVERVIRTSPAANVDPGPAGVAVLRDVTLAVETPLV